MNLSTRWQATANVVIILAGCFLIISSIALLFAVISSEKETITNREVGCISRYLDGQQYAPACQKFVDDFRERR